MRTLYKDWTVEVWDWSKKLHDMFLFDGILGGKLSSIMNKEELYGIEVSQRYKDHHALMSSFQAFFVETLEAALLQIERIGRWPADRPYYNFLIMYYTGIFKRFRAAEILYIHGYPLDGYSLLRDLKDKAIILGGVIHGFGSLGVLHGIGVGDVISDAGRKQAASAARVEERQVFDQMIRSGSGLSDNSIRLIRKWEGMFHDEVHGAKYTLFTELMPCLTGRIAYSIAPQVLEDSVAMYVCHSSQVAWLLIRTLRFLQLEKDSFGQDWIDKYRVLDLAFAAMLDDGSIQGKEIGIVFKELLQEKFSFDDSLTYEERNVAPR